ncbi:unnamed protein product [Amoebophrya sp. A120]|nr:unnamed protein product [Amoebophrya sp. A120]|eukprot:GSA120T00020521001.1
MRRLSLDKAVDKLDEGDEKRQRRAIVVLIDLDVENLRFQCSYCGASLLSRFISGFFRGKTERLRAQFRDALTYVWGRRVLHMDHKAENVCVREEADGYQLRLIDFGSAIFVADETTVDLHELAYTKPFVGEALNKHEREQPDMAVPAATLREHEKFTAMALDRLLAAPNGGDLLLEIVEQKDAWIKDEERETGSGRRRLLAVLDPTGQELARHEFHELQETQLQKARSEDLDPL